MNHQVLLFFFLFLFFFWFPAELALTLEAFDCGDSHPGAGNYLPRKSSTYRDTGNTASISCALISFSFFSVFLLVSLRFSLGALNLMCNLGAPDVSDSVTGRIVTDRVSFGGRTIEKQAFCES